MDDGDSAIHDLLDEDRHLPGILFIVATPIGNLEDVSYRAVRVLREVGSIAAEDTRHTRKLLSHYSISTPLLRYREENRASAIPRIIDRLRSGHVALVSDAGTPSIADPGLDLVARVAALGGRIEAIPGANAALTALVLSGLPTAPFTFLGFPPRQKGDRRRLFERLASRTDTLVFYEAPHRLRPMLTDLLAVLGDRRASLSRELTKRHEETVRGTLSSVVAHCATVEPRGEYTVVIGGGSARDEDGVEDLDDPTLDAVLHEAMIRGDDMRDVLIKLAVRSGRPRRELYARWQVLRREDR